MFNLFFSALHKRKVFSPELKDFLFKLYHGRLLFKRYHISLNDYLHNKRLTCSLCCSGVESPKHLFTNCFYGNLLRNNRDRIIANYDSGSSISEEALISSYISGCDAQTNVISLIIAMSNHTIYKFKMKKIYNSNEIISPEQIMCSFTKNLKNRIICDLKIHSLEFFGQLWDPGGCKLICDYQDDKIRQWFF